MTQQNAKFHDFGNHCLAKFWNIEDTAKLKNKQFIEGVLMSCLDIFGAKKDGIISISQEFDDAIFCMYNERMIAISITTFIENGSVFVDIFRRGSSQIAPTKEALSHIKDNFGAKSKAINIFFRQ